MAKTKIYDKTGNATTEIELPSCFSSKIREDICQKYFQAILKIQPYAPYYMAGKQHSASGNLSHMRHKWKTAYGKGISRVPRKIMWRRGDQFYWVGAEVVSSRGGRRAHPPRVEHFQKEKKINKKEKKIAMCSALSSTASQEIIIKRYENLQNKNIKISLPFIVKSDVIKLKSKEIHTLIKKILGEIYSVVEQNRKTRAGVGKSRNRPYKKNAGLLFVVSSKEKINLNNIEVKKVNELSIKELWPLGRLTLYTEDAIKELGEKL